MATNYNLQRQTKAKPPILHISHQDVHPIFCTWGLAWKSTQLDYLGQGGPGISLVCVPWWWDYKPKPHWAQISIGAEVPRSGIHAYMASALMVKPFSFPLKINLFSLNNF